MVKKNIQIFSLSHLVHRTYRKSLVNKLTFLPRYKPGSSERKQAVVDFVKRSSINTNEPKKLSGVVGVSFNVAIGFGILLS